MTIAVDMGRKATKKKQITNISVTACYNTLARSIYDMCNVWSVSVNIIASEVRSKRNKPKGEKGTRRKHSQKSGTSSS